jgi:hypothetical protein
VDELRELPWLEIEPGDIGFDGGIGISGWLIRRATGAYGHVFIYHEKIDDNAWRTVEAGPSGVLFRVRTRPANKVVRLWRTKIEQNRILAASAECVGRKYGWGEIARIFLHLIGIKINGWKDNKGRMICSNHVAYSISMMKKGVKYTLPYKPEHIWPQKLAQWCDWYTWTRARIAEKRRDENRGYL